MSLKKVMVKVAVIENLVKIIVELLNPNHWTLKKENMGVILQVIMGLITMGMDLITDQVILAVTQVQVIMVTRVLITKVVLPIKIPTRDADDELQF